MPPEPYAVFEISEGRNFGIDISYSAEAGRPRLDHPERFLHFVVGTRQPSDPLPPSLRPRELGGRQGRIARASTRGYAGEPYFANHVRFFWRQEGVGYVATLHNFGPGTTALLDALIARLVPADSLAAPEDVSGGVELLSVPAYGPVALATAPDGLWIATRGTIGGQTGAAATRAPSVLRIDPQSLEVTAGPVRVSPFFSPLTLAVGGADVWVAQLAARRSAALWRIDSDGELGLEPLPAGPELVAIAISDETLWAVDRGGWPGAADYRGGVVQGIDLLTREIVASVPVGRAPAGIAVDESAIWVTNNLDDSVSRIEDGESPEVETIAVGDGPVGIASGYGAVWVVNHDDETLSRIDPVAGEVIATLPVGSGPRGIAAGYGSIWVTNSRDDTVVRIDPETLRAIETIRVCAGPSGITIGDDAVWVACVLGRAVARIEPG